MAHLALCPRADIAPLPPAPAPSNATMRPRLKQNPSLENTLTWQHQEDLNAQKVGESNAQRLNACFTSGPIPLQLSIYRVLGTYTLPSTAFTLRLVASH